MLPFMQSLSGLARLWQTMNEEQKELLDGVLTQSVGPLLSGLNILPTGCGEILCSKVALPDKMAALATHLPSVLSEKKEDSKAVVTCCCPNCKTNFLKEIDYG